MSYELNLEQFKGPLEKLIELIEEEKLDINEVSLARVTDGFLKYLEEIQSRIHEAASTKGHDEEMRLIADFIVVASRLLLLKSKTLLPEFSLTREEEEDVEDLKRRLERYKELREAAKRVIVLWREGNQSWNRPYFLHISPHPTVFYPGTNVTIETLHEAMQFLSSALERFTKETEKIKEVIISLEEKMEEVLGRVKDAVETTLGALSLKRTKSEIVALFLAILHLAREERIHLEQKEHFSDIIIRKR